jgi:hypothetical protein
MEKEDADCGKEPQGRKAIELSLMAKNSRLQRRFMQE